MSLTSTDVLGADEIQRLLEVFNARIDWEIVAREYLRVSYDRTGEGASPNEQHDEHIEVCEERGWGLHPDPYVDLGSASPYATKTRDDYEQMIEDLRADQFGAHVLLLWEGSRGSRQVEEWIVLLKLLRLRGIKIYVKTRDRMYNPTNDFDWLDLMKEAVEHQKSSVETSVRAQRNARARAKKGKPVGRCNYGYLRVNYRKVRNEKGKLVWDYDQVEDPEWAPRIQELLGGWDAAGAEVPGRIEKGHSFRSIAGDWEARGIRQKNGNPFSPAGIRALADHKAYIGVRVHDAGRRGRKPSAKAVEYPADWPAIVPIARFLAVQRILSDPTRRTSRPGRGVHPLSMIALCDTCGGRMAARWRREKGKRGRKAIEEQEYYCNRNSCTRINYDALNRHVELILVGGEVGGKPVLGYLAREDVYVGLAKADAANAAALAAAEAEVERIRNDMLEVERLQRAGEYPPASAGRMLIGYQDDLVVAEKRAKELRIPSRLAGLIAPGPDVAQRWKDAPMSTRRETVRMLLSPEMLGVLRVHRAPQTGSHRTPVDQRVTLRRAA